MFGALRIYGCRPMKWHQPHVAGLGFDYHVANITKTLTFKPVQLEVDVTLGPGAAFNKLIDFMVASAASQLLRRAPMRQCDRCHHWYEIQKTTSRTCSAACRVALSRERKEQE